MSFFPPKLRNLSSGSSAGGMAYGRRSRRKSLGSLNTFLAGRTTGYQAQGFSCLLNGLWTFPSFLCLSRHRNMDKWLGGRSHPVSSPMNNKTSDLSAMLGNSCHAYKGFDPWSTSYFRHFPPVKDSRSLTPTISCRQAYTVLTHGPLFLILTALKNLKNNIAKFTVQLYIDHILTNANQVHGFCRNYPRRLGDQFIWSLFINCHVIGWSTILFHLVSRETPTGIPKPLSQVAPAGMGTVYGVKIKGHTSFITL